MPPRKPGRPREYGQRVVTAVRITKNVHKRLKIEAVKREIGINLIVQKACEDWLKRNEGKVKL